MRVQVSLAFTRNPGARPPAETAQDLVHPLQGLCERGGGGLVVEFPHLPRYAGEMLAIGSGTLRRIARAHVGSLGSRSTEIDRLLDQIPGT